MSPSQREREREGNAATGKLFDLSSSFTTAAAAAAFGTLLLSLTMHGGDDGAQLAAGRRMASVMQIGG